MLFIPENWTEYCFTQIFLPLHFCSCLWGSLLKRRKRFKKAAERGCAERNCPFYCLLSSRHASRQCKPRCKSWTTCSTLHFFVMWYTFPAFHVTSSPSCSLWCELWCINPLAARSFTKQLLIMIYFLWDSFPNKIWRNNCFLDGGHIRDWRNTQGWAPSQRSKLFALDGLQLRPVCCSLGDHLVLFHRSE